MAIVQLGLTAHKWLGLRGAIVNRRLLELNASYGQFDSLETFVEDVRR